VSLAVFPGPPPAPRPVAAPGAKLHGRVGVPALPVVGARGRRTGQQGEDLAPPGCPALPALPHPPREHLRRPGPGHLARCAQEVAAGRTAEGSRAVWRRHPLRAHARRATRPATLAPRQAHVAQQPHDRSDQPRAHAQGALQQRVARAAKRRRAAGGARTGAARALTLPRKADARPDAATRAGGSGLHTALPPPHAPHERVPDRDKALASVAPAWRPCPPAHLAVRPLFVRRAARPRAPAWVGRRAYPSLRSLASCGSACAVTVAEGLHALTPLGLVAGAPPNAPSPHCLPTPRDAIARVRPSANITLPKACSLSGTRGATKQKRQAERLVQSMQLLHWLLTL
jgi:hypothetical protein